MATPAPDYISVTADTLAKTGTGILYGVVVTTVLGAGAVTLYDSVTEANTPLLVIPASTAVGTMYHFPNGIRFKAGLYVGFASTGTINVQFR